MADVMKRLEKANRRIVREQQRQAESWRHPVLGHSGDLVRGVRCPRCAGHSVVYNGNYWCTADDCGWAMVETVSIRERLEDHMPIIWAYLAQRLADPRAKLDERRRMIFYMAHLRIEQLQLWGMLQEGVVRVRGYR